MRTLTIPLQIGASGGFLTTRDPAVICAQQIMDLLVTYRGERVMRETHGCDIQGFLFTNVENALLSLKRDDILEVLRRGISFGEIVSVQLDEVPQQLSTVRITVLYRVWSGDDVRTLTHTVSGLIDQETPM